MSTPTATGVFVDSNLLVLLVVGSFDRALIQKHRRLQEYGPSDFDVLVEIVREYGLIYVTPNTLTEASNLIAQHGEPQRTQLLETLRLAIGRSEEIVVASTIASQRTEFQRVGLADAVLLEAIGPDRPLLTAELELYLAAIEQNGDSALLLAHFRNL